MNLITPPESRKRNKVRSAWISFAGRIAAQIIGAIATVTLGVIVLGGREAPAAASSTAATVLIATPVRTHGETVIVMLPVGKDGRVDHAFARNVAESFEKTKAAAERQDDGPRMPIDQPAPQSGDPLADTRASLEFPRE